MIKMWEKKTLRELAPYENVLYNIHLLPYSDQEKLIIDLIKSILQPNNQLLLDKTIIFLKGILAKFVAFRNGSN